MLVDGAPENRVGQLVAVCFNLPASVNKRVGMLCRVDGVQHNRKVAAGRIFHACGNVKAADGETMLLVLHGAGADRHVGENIVNIRPVFRVEHFVRTGKAGLVDSADVHFAHGDDAGKEILAFAWIRLVDDALVAVPCGAGFVRVDPRDKDQPVLYSIVDFGEALHVLTDGIFVVGGAWTYDN